MYLGQQMQDKYLNENIFKNYKNGFYIDIGAHDGKDKSNTYYFYKNGWRGINVEPIPKVFDNLKLNKPNDINLNLAISEKDGYADFIINEGYTEMLSGLKNNYDSRHIDRINRELREHGGKSKNIKVKTKRLDNICNHHNIKHINLLSIDVEGGEKSVIDSIDFNKVFIDVIVFENNYSEQGMLIETYLKSKGYKTLRKGQDIFMIHQDSKFNEGMSGGRLKKIKKKHSKNSKKVKKSKKSKKSKNRKYK